MPFYRCMNPTGGSGGSESCEHIVVNYDGSNYAMPLLSYNRLSDLTQNVHGNNSTFNCPTTIGSAMVKADNLFADCYNFNSPVDMSNATNLISANQMFYLCYNYNQPTVFPNNVRDYFSTFRACLNYNQPTELFVSNNNTYPVNIIGTFMQCDELNSRIDITPIGNNIICVYDRIFYHADKFNQPMIFKNTGTLNQIFEHASSMRCPIVIDFAKGTENAVTGNNCAWDGCVINNIIILNYVNQTITWQGSAQQVTFYVNDPYTFVNRCRYLYRQGAERYNYIPIENGLQADVSYYNIRVLNNVSDGLNYFNEFYYNYYGEYPTY